MVPIGYFGSYARGDWGPGSDLDMILIVQGSEEAFERRAARWDTTALPVPVELLVYTTAEWEGLAQRSRFYQTVMREAIWVYVRATRAGPDVRSVTLGFEDRGARLTGGW